MLATGIARGTRGKDSAPNLLASGRDDVVGGKENWAVEGYKFVKLLPPGVTIVAREIIVFFESRVIVGGQHLAVGINIHAGAFGLL